MNDAGAAAVIENFQQAVIATYPDPIRRAFSTLIGLMVRRIRHPAEPILAQTDRATLDAQRQADDDPQYRLTMDAFHTSVLETSQAKLAAVASANLRIMEAARSAEGPPAVHRNPIEFHQQIDFAVGEAERQAALQRTGSAIAALLANARRHRSRTARQIGNR